MSEWILDKNHLSYWLRQLRNEMELIGPLRETGKDIVYKSVNNIHEIVLDCPASVPSPKDFLFPQYEPMLLLTETGREDRLKNKPLKNGIYEMNNCYRRVIFGVRSCDMSAIQLLDRFFLEGYKDPFYHSRRKNTLFISLVCNIPDSTCFCMGLGTGPYLKSGFDIQVTDLGDRYFVQADSHEGKKAVKANNFLFSRPKKIDYDDQYEVFISSKARFQKVISFKDPREMILSGKVDDAFWQSVSERCFECGGCVYDCPLCTCYTVIDRKRDEGMERSRLWDACLFKGFTRMAGNILPNEKKILRIKRWYYHKLIHYPDVLGSYGCVGCGRCTITCPGKIDMAATSIRIKGLAINDREK